jgi:exopolyphosphatase/guanosine-5'-triphosphate,3'-diphosphate pyrophosphatase
MLFRPVLRKRAYIRLAEGFDDHGRRKIRAKAIDRTLNVLQSFASVTKEFGVANTYAVATGVVRKAVNRDHFLELIYDQTGIEIRAISGEEEGRLTEKGVLHSLDIQDGALMVFDLGGGSTEFIFGENLEKTVRSIPLGAAILTQAFLDSDPPEDRAVHALVRHVDNVLREAFIKAPFQKGHFLLVGTGGTVTALAAMIFGIILEDIGPERINGLILKRSQLEALFARIKAMTLKQRLELPGLDRGRAGVILAGSVVVIRILHLFGSLQMAVSLSDLLEGLLIVNLEGEGHEQK